jgi:hypothetical protein
MKLKQPLQWRRKCFHPVSRDYQQSHHYLIIWWSRKDFQHEVNGLLRTWKQAAYWSVQEERVDLITSESVSQWVTLNTVEPSEHRRFPNASRSVWSTGGSQTLHAVYGAPLVPKRFTQCIEHRESLLRACIPWQWFWLGSLWIGLCNGTANQAVTDQITFCAAVFAPLVHVHNAHTVSKTKTCYSGLWHKVEHRVFLSTYQFYTGEFGNKPDTHSVQKLKNKNISYSASEQP